MAKRPFLPFYYADFFRSTKGWDAAHAQAYLRMLSHEWEEGNLPLDIFDVIVLESTPKILQKSVKKWVDSCQFIRGKFIEVNGVYYNEYLEEKRSKHGFISELRKKAGSKGGSKTQAKRRAKAQAGHEALEYRIENINTPPNPQGGDRVPFSVFWDHYEKKVGIDKVRKKWDDLKPADQAKAMEHITRYKLAQPNKKFRKDPATYINNRSWQDELIFDEQPQPTNGQQQLTTAEILERQGQEILAQASRG